MRYPPAVALINVVVKAPHAARRRWTTRARSSARCGAGRRAVPRARTRAGAARPAERRAPRAVVHQGHAARTRCARRCWPCSTARPELKRRDDRGRRSDERAVDGSARSESIAAIGTGVKQRTNMTSAKTREQRRGRRRAARTRRSRADGAGRAVRASRASSTVITIQLDRDERHHDRAGDRRDRDRASTGGRASRR